MNQYEVLGLRNLDIQIVPRDTSAEPSAGAEAVTDPDVVSLALQDYRMQLMLLEQQNKKRPMMARQEQYENNPIIDERSRPGVGTQAPSPVHEDYSELFSPEEIAAHVAEHSQAWEGAQQRDEIGANIVDIS